VTATSSSDPADAHTVEVFGGSTTTARITGLQGGATYDVVVVACSIGHNPSAASNAVQGTPADAPPADAATPGGGNGARKMTGGCASAPGGLAALAALAVPFALRRRARG
jgi:MYXO-CTERM domain-containing protein